MVPAGAGESPPWIACNPGADSPFLLVGDHAGRLIPTWLTPFGLPPAELERHIAWDIGVAGLGETLAQVLKAPFIQQRFSRLVIDCNRDPASPAAIPPVSDGTAIPANASLAAQDRKARVEALARPYHARIAAELDARAVRDLRTILVALHSFTPRMNGQPRPWRFGVVHAHDSPFSLAMLARLRADLGPDLVGDNQPYAMDGNDYTVPHHAGSRGLDYLEIEVRQDLMADRAGQEAVAARLARLLPLALADIGG